MITRSDFPDGFLFGTATSAYQIEGHSFGGAGETHWDAFAQTAGNVVRNETGAIACDHYHRYAQDLDLLKGFDAYRFSTSWARVLPDGRGQVNSAGLDFYDRLVDAVLARNLEPHLTLYHWDLPETLSRLGGWRNRDIAGWFGDYADIVMDRIGDRVASVATINEPWCVAYLSHFLGHHAPGMQDMAAAALAMHNVLRAHGEALGRLRARGQKELGIVLNFEAIHPASPSRADLDAANRYDAIMNRMFIEPIINATYPAHILDAFEQYLPQHWQADMAEISKPIDWLGVNYYTCQTVADSPKSKWPHLQFIQTERPKTQMGWDIYPQGLADILVWLSKDFIGACPIFITENGMAQDDSVLAGAVHDDTRIDFIEQHLVQTINAIQQGCNIKGYFYWSLLDNFEWAFGYEKRFGLIHVDFETLTRTPKKSFDVLRQLTATE